MTFGLENIFIEVWKILGDRCIEWLIKLFNEILKPKQIPDKWRRNTLFPIYRNKEDIQNCANYKGG